MGFIIHFYIIFGTNLLTGGPTQMAIFCLFQCSVKKEYQTESKGNETFGNVIFGTNVIQRTWSERQETNEESTRQGARLPPGRALPLMGPSWLNRPTSSSYIYSYTLKTTRNTMKPYFHRRNLLYPRDPILGPFWSSARGGIDHGGPLHQLHGPSDDVSVVYFRPSGP